ncbi:MAG: hypothetical protein AAF944_08870 [Bacteroidota bacterium]
MQCSLLFFPLSLFILLYQSKANDLSAQTNEQSLEEIKAQYDSVAQKIDIITHRYLDKRYHPKQPTDSAMLVRRNQSLPRLPDKDRFTDRTLYKLHELASDQDYQVLIGLVERRNVLLKKWRALSGSDLYL